MSGMKPVDLYARVRYACHVEGLSQRETVRRFGIDTKTVRGRPPDRAGGSSGAMIAHSRSVMSLG